jgi:cytochrome P450 family 138
MNAVTLPDGPSLPRFVQGGMALAAPLWMMRRLGERYGSAFTLNVPVFGKAVVISDPAGDRVHAAAGRSADGQEP